MSEQEKATFRQFVGLLLDDKPLLESIWRANQGGGEPAVRNIVQGRGFTLTDEDFTALLRGLPPQPPERPEKVGPILDAIYHARGLITPQASWRW